MKKIFYIFSFLFTIGFTANAQSAGDGTKVRERMVEYIQKKLDLTQDESEKFTPVFMQYFRELRQTNQQYRGDNLVLQQKIVELRIRYRDQFKPIIGEKRSNEVFHHERTFMQEARNQLEDRLQNKKDGRANE
jgi:hypothetical protein